MAPYLSPAPPRVFAHRGLAIDALENTAAAFEAAFQAGAQFVETDAHVTQDGVAVLWHDHDLRRFDGSRDRIGDLSWAQIQARANGARAISSVQEVLERFPNGRFNIDIKVEAAREAVVRAVVASNARERVLLASFSDARRRHVSRDLPGVATSTGMSAVVRCVLGLFLSRTKCDTVWVRAVGEAVAFQVPRSYFGIPIVTRRFVETAHRLGVEVHVWTINDARVMRDLLRIGVDGIVTDRTDIACRVMGFSTAES